MSFLDSAGLTYLWSKIKAALDEKQGKLTGTPGQVVGFDADGHAAAQLPSLAPFAAGTSAPADTTKLWIDTTANTGGLKYWNGSAWVHVPMSTA